MFVSHYRATRHYGGPEEGGWWYDRMEFVEVEFRITGRRALERAREEAIKLNRQAQREHRQPCGAYQGRYSVAGHTDDIYRTEEVEREHETIHDPKPHYE